MLEIENVEQVLLEQRFSDKSVTEYEEISSFLLFELLHFRSDVPSDKDRVIPFGAFQRGCERIFRMQNCPFARDFLDELRLLGVGGGLLSGCVAGPFVRSNRNDDEGVGAAFSGNERRAVLTAVRSDISVRHIGTVEHDVRREGGRYSLFVRHDVLF